MDWRRQLAATTASAEYDDLKGLSSSLTKTVVISDPASTPSPEKKKKKKKKVVVVTTSDSPPPPTNRFPSSPLPSEAFLAPSPVSVDPDTLAAAPALPPPGGRRATSTSRRHSVMSASSIAVLDACEVEYANLAAQVSALEAPLPPGGHVSKQLNLCHHLHGLLEKFQYVKVDGVITAELTSGKEEARDRRRNLNARCEELRARLDARSRFLQDLAEADKGAPPGSEEGDGGRATEAPAAATAARRNTRKVTIVEEKKDRDRAPTTSSTGSISNSPSPSSKPNNWLDLLPETRLTSSSSVWDKERDSSAAPYSKPSASFSLSRKLALSSTSADSADPLRMLEALDDLDEGVDRDFDADFPGRDQGDDDGGDSAIIDSKASSLTGGNRGRARTAGGTLDGEILRPVWEGVSQFVRTYNPEKNSVARYKAMMKVQILDPDAAVVDFLLTPAAHANSLRLAPGRLMKAVELDIIGKMFSQQFYHVCKLRELSLDGLGLQDGHVDRLANHLPDIPTLESITLSRNRIGDKGALSLAVAIAALKNLVELALDYNAIGARGAVAISKGVAKLIQLKILTLSGNPIGDYGVYAVASALLRHCPQSFDWEPDIPNLADGMGEDDGVKLDWSRVLAADQRSAWETGFTGYEEMEVADVDDDFASRSPSRMLASAVGGSSGTPSPTKMNTARGSMIPPPKRGTMVPPPPGRPNVVGKRGTVVPGPPPPKRGTMMVPPPPGPPPSGGMQKRGTMAPGPPPPGFRGVKRQTMIMGPGGVRQSIIPGPPGKVPTRMSIIPAPPGYKRMSRIAPPPAGSQFRQALNMSAMILQEAEGDEDDEDNPNAPPASDNKSPTKKAGPAINLDDLKKQMGIKDKSKAAVTSAADKVKQAVAARSEEDRKLRLKARVKVLWRYFRGVVQILGRYRQIHLGDVKLNVLACANCGITALGIQWLLHACKFNPNISTLNLSDNRIGLDGVIVISEYLLWIETLDEIILDGNIMRDEAIRILMKGAEGNISLSSCSLERCDLDGTSLNWITSSSKDYYIDEICFSKGGDELTAGAILEKYTMEVANMGDLIEISDDLRREMEEYSLPQQISGDFGA